MIELSLMDGTWETLRAAMLEGEAKPPDALPFQAVADEYYRSWVMARNKSTAAKKSFLARFKSRFRNVPPKAFRIMHADRYISWRRDAGMSNSTINRELACLRHMFVWAAKRGYVERNPLEALELLEEQEWAGPKPTGEIVQAVFDKRDPRFLPIFVVIRETGARRGEVLGLCHWQVDRQSRIITFASGPRTGRRPWRP